MKIVWMVLVVALVVLVPLSITTPVAKADGAIVIHKDGPCGMIGSDANGNLTNGPGHTGQVWHAVENQNKITMTCKGDDIPNLSGRGQTFNGFPCALLDPPSLVGPFLFTFDSRATVSASGQGSLTCTFNKP